MDALVQGSSNYAASGTGYFGDRIAFSHWVSMSQYEMNGPFVRRTIKEQDIRINGQLLIDGDSFVYDVTITLNGEEILQKTSSSKDEIVSAAREAMKPHRLGPHVQAATA